MADDDDWVGEPPEGRHTRDQAKPDFWRNQWQAIVATITSTPRMLVATMACH